MAPRCARSRRPGSSISAPLGRSSGRRQTWFRVRMPAASATSSAEGLAAAVLGHLHVEAEQLRDDRVERAAALAVALQAPAQLGVAGVELLADGVHDVLGVALDHGHRGHQAIDQPALVVAPAAGWRARPTVTVRSSSRGFRLRELAEQLAGLTSTAASSNSSEAIAPRCGRSQGTRGELDRVRGLVQGDPAAGRARGRRPGAAGRPRGWAPRTAAAARAWARSGRRRTGRPPSGRGSRA